MVSPSCLIACPTSSRHNYVLDEYLAGIRRLDRKADLLMLDTTLDDGEYADLLRSKGVDVMRYKWNIKEEHVLQMLAHARDRIRQYCLKEGYDYLFSLDSDTIVARNSIQRLMGYDKDQVGYVVHVYHKPEKLRPAVFKSGRILFTPKGFTLDYYSWSWVRKYYGQLKRVYACSLGCLMIKRRVLEKVVFRTHPTFIYGEDLWYYAEAHDKGFEAYCDIRRVIHKNTSWEEPLTVNLKRTSFIIAYGPPDATEAVFVEKNWAGAKLIGGIENGRAEQNSKQTNRKQADA